MMPGGSSRRVCHARCSSTRIFRAQREFDKMTRADSQAYRKNVRVHVAEPHDF